MDRAGSFYSEPYWKMKKKETMLVQVWVKISWVKIRSDIIESFKKCRISDTMDRTKNDIHFDHNIESYDEMFDS